MVDNPGQMSFQIYLGFRPIPGSHRFRLLIMMPGRPLWFLKIIVATIGSPMYIKPKILERAGQDYVILRMSVDMHFCFEQDPVEPRLMFVGTEFGLYVSFDAGSIWNKWSNDIPTMPITDLVIHPRDHDLVLGTFGRSIWILDDIRPLREIASQGFQAIINKEVHVYPAPDAYLDAHR